MEITVNLKMGCNYKSVALFETKYIDKTGPKQICVMDNHYVFFSKWLMSFGYVLVFFCLISQVAKIPQNMLSSQTISFLCAIRILSKGFRYTIILWHN